MTRLQTVNFCSKNTRALKKHLIKKPNDVTRLMGWSCEGDYAGLFKVALLYAYCAQLLYINEITLMAE